MSRKLQLLFFAIGLAGLVWMIAHIGPGRLAADFRQAGWLIIPIVLSWAPAYAMFTWTWMIVMADEPNRPPFPRAFAITVAGFAINWVTPVVAMGGEPFKVAATAPWIGTRRATGSIILFTMIHALSNLVFWLIASLIGLYVFRRNPEVVGPLILLALLFAGLIWLVMAGHQKGYLERILSGMHRVPLVRRLARVIEPRRTTLMELDEQIVSFYHARPLRFFAAVGVDLAGRALAVFEYVFILHAIGIDASYLTAFLINNFSSFVVVLFFFMPFAVGSKEGSLYLVLRLLGMGAGVGVFTAMASRLRELVWIGIGFALMWVAGGGVRRLRARSG